MSIPILEITFEAFTLLSRDLNLKYGELSNDSSLAKKNKDELHRIYHKLKIITESLVEIKELLS